jgi:hypothetical protein
MSKSQPTALEPVNHQGKTTNRGFCGVLEKTHGALVRLVENREVVEK